MLSSWPSPGRFSFPVTDASELAILRHQKSADQYKYDKVTLGWTSKLSDIKPKLIPKFMEKGTVSDWIGIRY